MDKRAATGSGSPSQHGRVLVTFRGRSARKRQASEQPPTPAETHLWPKQGRSEPRAQVPTISSWPLVYITHVWLSLLKPTKKGGHKVVTGGQMVVRERLLSSPQAKAQAFRRPEPSLLGPRTQS